MFSRVNISVNINFMDTSLIYINNINSKKTKNYNQQNKTKEERQKNSKSLEINSIQGILGQNILLVDDIIASGSTISRCTNLLKPLCKSINIVAIAKS